MAARGSLRGAVAGAGRRDLRRGGGPSRARDGGASLEGVPMTATESRRFARPGYAGVDLHDPPRGDVAIDLSDNTNRWGAPPAAARALLQLPPTALARY